MRGNLFGDEESSSRRRELLAREIGVVLVILAIVIPGVHYYFNYQQVEELRAEKQDREQQVQRLQEEHEEYENLQQKLTKLDELAEFEFVRYRVGAPMRELSRLLPEEAVFSSINFSGGEMTLSGYAVYEDKLEEFAEEVEESDFFNLLELESEQEEERYGFEMELGLETGESLP